MYITLIFYHYITQQYVIINKFNSVFFWHTIEIKNYNLEYDTSKLKYEQSIKNK